MPNAVGHFTSRFPKRSETFVRQDMEAWIEKTDQAQVFAFFKEEDGLTAVEYAIAGSLVVGGAVLAFSTLGDSVEAKITCLDGAVNGAATPCS